MTHMRDKVSHMCGLQVPSAWLQWGIDPSLQALQDQRDLIGGVLADMDGGLEASSARLHGARVPVVNGREWLAPDDRRAALLVDRDAHGVVDIVLFLLSARSEFHAGLADLGRVEAGDDAVLGRDQVDARGRLGAPSVLPLGACILYSSVFSNA